MDIDGLIKFTVDLFHMCGIVNNLVMPSTLGTCPSWLTFTNIINAKVTLFVPLHVFITRLVKNPQQENRNSL